MTLQEVAQAHIIKPVDIEAVARLLNGVALNAALLVDTSDDPEATRLKVLAAITRLASGVLASQPE